jgi:hypothetical protein
LDLANIQDSQLKQEVNDFYNDCYLPAYSSYLSHQLSSDQQNQIQQSLQTNGKDDVGWLGSQTFLNVSGLYDAHNATKPIDGFPFDPDRDQEEGQVPNHSPNGMPDCKAWWSDPDNGLQSKLKTALPPTFWQKLTNIGGDQNTIQNAAIKNIITHNFGSNQTIADKVRGYESGNDNQSGDFISRYIGGTVGTVLESFSFFPKLHLIINALPVIQGSLLFGLYAFLALAIPFSSYRINFCVVGSVVMFSLIFCSFLWNLTAWFDNYLIQALYPTLGDIGGLGILNSATDLNPNELFVDMIVGALYVVLPILWMAVMSWCGYHAGLHVSGLFNSMLASAGSAGEKAGSRVTRYLP